MQRGDHKRTNPCALLNEVGRIDRNNIGAEHVRVDHLRLQRDHPFGERRRRAIIMFVLNHLNGNLQALESLHRAPVRERDYAHIVARVIKA